MAAWVVVKQEAEKAGRKSRERAMGQGGGGQLEEQVDNTAGWRAGVRAGPIRKVDYGKGKCETRRRYILLSGLQGKRVLRLSTYYSKDLRQPEVRR